MTLFRLVLPAPLALAACGAVVEVPVATQLPGTPTLQEQACLAAVSRESNNGDVVLLGSQFSQAGTSVQVGVGPTRARWLCNADSMGNTYGVMFDGEG